MGSVSLVKTAEHSRSSSPFFCRSCCVTVVSFQKNLSHCLLSLFQTSLLLFFFPNLRIQIQVRSLANYCLDLRFQRPRIEQIKAAILSIACKEHVNIPPAVLTEIIQASNQDIRQVRSSVFVLSLNVWVTNRCKDFLSFLSTLGVVPASSSHDANRYRE